MVVIVNVYLSNNFSLLFLGLLETNLIVIKEHEYLECLRNVVDYLLCILISAIRRFGELMY